jgi:hypothetical protein
MATHELDLAIPDMDRPDGEKRVKETLEILRGIVAVRIIERGAWVRFRPESITAEEICEAIRQSGYRASIFQDTSGRTGKSSQ